MKKNRKGFTLIELLVVIAIIGLLSTLAIVSLNTARQKSRDTKRQADIRTLQSAVELCINESGNPPAVTATWAGMLAETCGTGGPAFSSFLASGNMPIPPSGGTTCTTEPIAGNCYTYCTDGTPATYLLAAQNENAVTGGLTANVVRAAGTCVSVASDGTTTGKNTSTAFAASACNANKYFCLGK